MGMAGTAVQRTLLTCLPLDQLNSFADQMTCIGNWTLSDATQAGRRGRELGVNCNCFTVPYSTDSICANFHFCVTGHLNVETHLIITGEPVLQGEETEHFQSNTKTGKLI